MNFAGLTSQSCVKLLELVPERRPPPLHQMHIPKGTSTQERYAINILPSALLLRTSIIETDALSGCNNMPGGGRGGRKPGGEGERGEDTQCAAHRFHRNVPVHSTPPDPCSYTADVFGRPSQGFIVLSKHLWQLPFSLSLVHKVGGTVCPSDAKATLNDN